MHFNNRISCSLVCVVLTCAAVPSDQAAAATSNQSVEMDCSITDGRGTAYKRAIPGASSKTPTFEKWVLAGDGLTVGDRMRLYWHRPVNEPARLRMAIDGPVSKPAHIVSITDDSVAAYAVTSDQDTTRVWQFVINFRRKTVIATGIASNAYRLAGQIMSLSCKFKERLNTDKSMADAADHWK